LSFGSWYETSERRELRLAFLNPGFFDGTPVLIELQGDDKEQAFNVFNFMEPFSNSVWLLIFGAILVNAFTNYALHKMSGTRVNAEEKQLKGRAVFESAIGFTGSPSTGGDHATQVSLSLGSFVCSLSVLCALTPL
jgi:hypothetical protein